MEFFKTILRKKTKVQYFILLCKKFCCPKVEIVFLGKKKVFFDTTNESKQFNDNSMVVVSPSFSSFERKLSNM